MNPPPSPEDVRAPPETIVQTTSDSTASAEPSEDQLDNMVQTNDPVEGAEDMPDLSADRKAKEGSGSKPKKNNTKNKTQGGKMKPTGFEDYYTDKPILPEEWNTERALYSRDKDFIERISTAMQRYETGRRFNAKRRLIFDDYLLYGGVDSRPKQFGAGEHDNATAAEIREAKGKAQIERRVLEGFGKTVVVDFNGTVSSWLSMRCPRAFELCNSDQVTLITRTIHNFFNYLLQHDVCPEYAEDIRNARQTCNTAEHEFLDINELRRVGLGAWHHACATLFDRDVRESHGLKSVKPMDSSSDQTKAEKDAARQLVTKYLPHFITDFEIEPVNFIKSVVVTDEIQRGFDVLAIRKLEDQPFHLVDAKTWDHPVKDFTDTTEVPEPAEIDKLGLPDGKITFVFDDNVAEYMFVGLKFDATLKVTNKPGFYFLDSWTSLYPSFLTVTWNEWMRDYKPHKPRERKTANRGQDEEDFGGEEQD